MLHITIPAQELFNDETNEFLQSKEYHLQLEHSLVSISKWESKWKKPFLSDDVKTNEQTIDYVKCMTITQNIPPEAYNFLTNDNMREITEYIESSMTATWFTSSKESGGGKSKEVVTSELIYYWMIAYNIPVEFQKWHLNRLLTLIRICNIKNQPEKKMSKKEILSRNARLNEERRKAMQSKG